VRLAGDDARPTPFGAMTFRISPNNAAVNYKREDETQNHSAVNGGSVRLRAGGYSVSAVVPGFVSRTEKIGVSPGKTETIDWMLEPVIEKKLPPPPPPVQTCLGDMSWKADGMGAIHAGPDVGWFCRNEGLIELQIKNPKSRGKKNVEWSADWRDANNRIDYTLDQKNIERKVYVAGRVVDHKKSPSQMGAGEIWKLEISIRPDKIVIASSGRPLDEFQRPNPSTTPGKLGFKGDVELKQLNQ